MSDDERYVWMLHDAAADIYGADLTNYRGFACGAEWGAGWMAAIIGMGQAIADREPEETWQDRSVRLAGR